MYKNIIIANWKMQLDLKESVEQAKILKKYILSYMCYLFGASYQNCIINNFKIKNENYS